MIFTFPIKNNKDFLKLYKKGKFFVAKYLVLYVLSNNSNVNRLGITVSKKFGKSVKRNRIKRLIKESYRHFESQLKQGFDLVFVARSCEEMPNFSEVKKEMKYLLRKLEVFKEDI
ncbi:ribonuclease P protein component [Acetivibrio clariflavus]|uniref:Ribonuclease P protein component n=1 Tax=Acetivibrio clariflavus (strain DSM 19732 / NBRC 101661 / EBR45) TaxID=720554 RepID=G8LV62_ACECE|nr:ribonuclease P protein component [Acetivibrio clariflavus]AEV70651.1 ribonuclease P protein component [Acetivibrio clariflavus DSM 19732]